MNREKNSRAVISVREDNPFAGSVSPGAQEVSKPLLYAGLFLRLLPVYALLCGLYLITDNAFGIGAEPYLVLPVTAFTLILVTLACYKKAVRIVGLPLLSAGWLLYLFLCRPEGSTLLWAPVNLASAFFNSGVRHMMTVGYPTLYAFLIDMPLSRAQETEGAHVFFLLLCVLVTAVFAVCTAKKIITVPLVCVAGLDLFVIFVYNITYSKWGFALTVAGIAGILCLKLCDRYEQGNVTARGFSVSGISAAVFSLIAFAVIALPAAKVTGRFPSIPAIDSIVDIVRSYEMEIITGENMQISDLGLTGAAEILEGRSALASPRSFTGATVLDVESNVTLPVYLRSWVSTTFRDNKWYVADKQTIDDYRETFGEEFRAEDLTYRFYRDLSEKLVRYTQKTSYSDHGEDGFVTTLVSVANRGVSGNLLFLPSTFDASRGILNFGTLSEPWKKNSINYFDGAAYSRAFRRGTEYSAVAFLPVFREDGCTEALNQKLYTMKQLSADLLYLGESAGELFEPDSSYAKNHAAGGFPLDGFCTYFSSLAPKEKREIFREFELAAKYDDFVRRDGLYLSLTEDEELNEKLRVLAYEIVFAEPLPDTGVRLEIGTVDGSYFADLTELLCGISSDSTVSAEIKPEEFLKMLTSGDLLYLYSAEFARRIAEYLSENMTYTLDPASYDPEEPVSAVGKFLFETKEGYCVQYATAETLLLRALGIPARYVEGYLASNFSRNTEKDRAGNYIAHVRDRDAHAWVEVYLPYYGWLTAEATAPYYSAMYDPYETQQYTPSEPKESTGEQEIPEDPGELPVEEEETFWEASGKTIVKWAFVILCTAAVVFLLYLYFDHMARKREGHRAMLDGAVRGTYPEEETRRVFTTLSERLFGTLAVLGLKPKQGETPRAFFERVNETFSVPGDTEDAVTRYEKNEFSMKAPEKAELSAYAAYLLRLYDRIREETGKLRVFILTKFAGLL